VTYDFWKQENSGMFLRAGLFPYDYNPDIRNLGLYLLRGPVYPGFVISGFENKYVLPIANMLGLQWHHEIGGFRQDVVVKSETDFYPFFDLSPAYLASYGFGKALRLGGGVNLYHFIAMDDSLTSSRKWFYVDSTRYFADTVNNRPDSTYLSFKGVKLMAYASLDPKAFLGSGSFGPEDLKLYGEAAIFGLDNDKAHRAIFGDALHRMPVMFGFNFPMFNLLDHLSLEVEWYGAPYLDDMLGFRYTAANRPGPMPRDPNNPSYPQPGEVNLPYFNYRRDNWKWSLHGARVLKNHIKVTFQLANDHFRPGIYRGDSDDTPAGSESIMVTPKDWYGMLQLAYFF